MITEKKTRMIEQRRTDGKAVRKGPKKNGTPVSLKSLLKTYQEETARQRLVIQKAKLCETRLLFVVASLKQLFDDDNFVNLLRAEALNTLPSYLSTQINAREASE